VHTRGATQGVGRGVTRTAEVLGISRTSPKLREVALEREVNGCL
jgi:hypothetical protein